MFSYINQKKRELAGIFFNNLSEKGTIVHSLRSFGSNIVPRYLKSSQNEATASKMEKQIIAPQKSQDNVNNITKVKEALNTNNALSVHLVQFRPGFAWNNLNSIYPVETQHISVVVKYEGCSFFFSIGNLTTNAYSIPLKQHGKLISVERLDGSRKYRVKKTVLDYKKDDDNVNLKTIISDVWLKATKEELKKNPDIIDVKELDNTGQYFVETSPIVIYDNENVTANLQHVSEYLKKYYPLLLKLAKNVTISDKTWAYLDLDGLTKNLNQMRSNKLAPLDDEEARKLLNSIMEKKTQQTSNLNDKL